MACWLAHEAIGLNYNGYGSILRQVSFNRAMVSSPSDMKRAYMLTVHIAIRCLGDLL